MSDKVTGAVETHRDTGFNCAQSVLGQFAPEMGMDTDIAAKVACGFGSGMGRSGNMCGAVTGGILVLGLKYGMSDPEASQDKEKTYEKVRNLLNMIREKCGSVNCKDLLGVDVGTEEGRRELKEKNLSDKVCAKVVGEVVRSVEMLFDQ
jgi:C_GCAxxG_C_C family probable redox protein